MDNWTVEPAFNRQRTIEKRTVDGREVELVTGLVIETALPLILTQDADKANEPNHQYVPESADLKVFADHITILGKLSLPGRSVEILARVLHASADGGVEPAIIVDGPDLPEKLAKPEALPKGVSPRDKPTKIKVLKGKKGDNGYNDRIQPFFLASERMEPGKAGWSMWDHPDEMNGEPGKDGEKGLGGGAISILCGETQVGPPLSLSAVGGPGGDGGTILVHCLSNSPSIATACGGGRGGSRGNGGAGGQKGLGGPGGDPVWIQLTGPLGGSSREIPGSANGEDSIPGPPGGDGQDAPASQTGSASVTAGEVSNQTMAKLVSVSQFQMLFERVRAEYLVTEPPRYHLQLQSVQRSEDIVAAGRNLVVAAAVGARLHIRVFDPIGTMVVDAAEGELTDLVGLTALKETLKSNKLNFAPAIEITPRGALLAGKWVKETDPEPNGGWQTALMTVLKNNADIRGRESYYASLGDRGLSSMVAAIGFLLRTGVCDQRALQSTAPHHHKQVLVEAIQDWSGRSWEELAGLPIEALVEIGAESTDAFRRDETLEDLSDDDQQLIIEQIALLFEDADWSRWYRIGTRLGWVAGILNMIPKDHHQKSLAATICQSAWNMLTNYNRGLDYYGKTPRFTPILSLDTYLTALASSLSTLKDIEEKAELYFDALRDQKDATNDLQAAVNQTNKALALLNVRRDKILESLSETSAEISNLDSEQKAAKKGLKQELDNMKFEVKKAFGLTPETFLNCLFQLSFINVHEPANALDMGTRLGLAGGMGLVQAGAMATSQLGLMIKEAKENVLNSSGERINQKLLLDQIETIADDADLQAEFTKRESGILGKEGSARLLVDLAKFRDLCKQFYGLGNARTVREKLDGYIDTITKRNRYIDYYNLLVGGLLDLSAEINRLKLQRTAVQGAIATKIKPGLPAMATFVSGLHERAKAVCVSDLYHAYRAYAFWALEPYSGFYDKIGRNPDGLNYVQLNIAKNELSNDIVNALGNNYRTPNHFPASEENESSFGRIVVLTKKSHPDFFADLWDSGEAEFELEPANQRSMVPKSSFAPTDVAWSFERPEFDVTQRNPFAGMADVRLTKVRIWLVGKESSLDHKVVLTHLGREQFRAPNDKCYPERVDTRQIDQDKRQPEYILHEPVSIPFNYNAKGLRYNERTFAFTPGKLFGGVVGAQDGDLGFPKSGIVDLPAAGKYAPIGPFARWRIEVPQNLNPALKLSDVHAVVIDFHGFHQSYAARA